MEARVAESDIVYTFLHCLVRDIQDLARIQEGGRGLPSPSPPSLSYCVCVCVCVTV